MRSVPKSALFFSLTFFLAACGGGGGGSSNNDSGQNSPADNTFPVTADNYVRAASAVYTGSVTAALTTVTAASLPLTLIRTTNQQAPVTTSCRSGGDKTTDIQRLPFNEPLVHDGDYYEQTFSNCDDTGLYALQGSQSTTVESITGTYSGSNDYTVRIDADQSLVRSGDSIQSNNGRYNQHLRVTLSQRESGDLKMYGVNALTLHAGSAPSLTNNPFADIIAEDIQTPDGNPQHVETPSSRFDVFAFEQIVDNTVTNTITSFDWLLDVENLETPAGSHVTRTILPVELEERSRVNGDGNNEDFIYAVGGFFTISFDSGEYISVFIRPSRSDLTSSPNMTISFDEDNDGTFEAETLITWEEFEFAFFGI